MSKRIHYKKSNSKVVLVFSTWLLFSFLVLTTQAQNPINIEVNSTNILNTPSFDLETFASTSCLASIGANLTVQATGNFTAITSPYTNPIPAISTIHLKLKSIGSSLLSLSSTKDVDLSASSAQSLYTAVLSLVSGGSVVINYSILNRPATYYAGVFTSGLQFKISGILCSSNPPINPLTLTVKPFIVPSQPPPINMAVTSFDQYRLTGISASQTFTNLRTVPMTLQIKADNPFNFSGATGITDPNTSIGLLQARLNLPIQGTYQSLSASYQTLSGASNLAVPTGNQASVKLDYTIAATALTSGFLQAGTYSSSIKGLLSDSRQTPSNPAPTVTTSSELTVTIPDLKEMKINQSDINMVFSKVSDYQNGISVDMPSHLTISNTNPFDVYVKSESASLTQQNGADIIPVNCIQIGSLPGESEVQTVTLSTTAQKLISGNTPCLDKTYNIRYSIPASETSKIFGKPEDNYTTTIVYSFTAP